ncbi:hypothetical protein [Streptomyces sp. DH7]|nr:hypothetical protein [Streptomyces sp. DH7]
MRPDDGRVTAPRRITAPSGGNLMCLFSYDDDPDPEEQARAGLL